MFYVIENEKQLMITLIQLYYIGTSGHANRVEQTLVITGKLNWIDLIQLFGSVSVIIIIIF